MKLRKSLVKPVTRQNIWSCLVLPHEIVEHEAFNIILWTSADICIVVRDDLRSKNQTTRYNCRFSAASLALPVILVRRKRPPIYASCMTISVMGGKKEIYRDVRLFRGALLPTGPPQLLRSALSLSLSHSSLGIRESADLQTAGGMWIASSRDENPCMWSGIGC